MANNLYVFEREIPTVSIMRTEMLGIAAERQLNIRFQRLKDFKKEDLEWADTVCLIRPNNIYACSIARMAKTAGCLVHVFCDDDLLNLPANTCSVPWRTKALRKVLAYADVFSTSSPHIAEKYGELVPTGRTFCMDTVVLPEELAAIPHTQKSGENIRIVYAAGRDHAPLFTELIEPIVPKLAQRYGVRISFAFVGLRPDTERIEKLVPCAFFPPKPLQEYRDLMRSENFDIGLAPLPDTPFNRCKYFNKYIEYTLVGVPGIYSGCEPYTYVIRDGENGFLAENTPEAWYRAICYAIDHPECRKSISANAERQLAEEFTESGISGKFLKELPELSAQHREKKVHCWIFPAKLQYAFYRVADILYILAFAFRQGGIPAVKKKIAGHFA